MRVDDNDGDDDGGDDEHHREEHVLSYERNGAGGGGDQLHDDEQEDSQRQQDGDGQSHLFTWRDGHTKTDIQATFTITVTPQRCQSRADILCYRITPSNGKITGE